MAFIRDDGTLLYYKLINLDRSLDIGAEKYMPALFGYPVVKEPTLSNKKSRKLLKKM